MAQRPKSEAAPSSNLVTAATRERISRAAVTAFEMYGLSRLRVDDVARLAGVSRPTVYRAFPDRESLILEILVHLALQLNQRIHSTVPLNAPLTEVLEKIMVMTVQTYA
ncbi:MAG: TetR/AcrR family transcriptional regulator, partial [Caulobacteraceae bacterium]|nr:TetR/AcrR family transcriptional regulator [Caulobacteraceae bacterium]